ncbi:MAG: DUF4349 domain-containing protein [Xanthomonadaceae bacterium]|nr:DUF4349 domain-containing protein [Xanthomonadaceae bacterium]
MACSKTPHAEVASAMDGVRSPADAALAYEHNIEVILAGDRIPGRMQEVQRSCGSDRFGQCVVLGIQQQAGDYPRGELTVRIVPEGVEQLVAQAGEGAKIGSRNTSAEDLAQAVQSNALLLNRLQKEHARLLEFLQRRDLPVSDVITVSQRLSEVEAQLDVAQQEGAQHRRRIDTQLVTFDFHPPGLPHKGRDRIREAFSDFGDIFSGSTAWLIRAIAALLPIVVALGILVAIIRGWRRRSKRKKAQKS